VARQRANDLGVSLAEYFRRLVARDLARPETAARVDRIFDLGKLGRLRHCEPEGFHDCRGLHSTRRKLRSLALSRYEPICRHFHLYAAADSSDRSNARSKAILRSGETLVTSDPRLVETWTLLHHKLDRKAAEGFWEGLRSGIRPNRSGHFGGPGGCLGCWRFLRDQDFSIVDRTASL